MRAPIRIFAAFTTLVYLLACDGPEATQEPAPSESGTARLYLPSLPAGYLAKAGKIAHAKFELTVSAKGKVLKKKSWNLDGAASGPLEVTGIPAGPDRVFAGRLLRDDSVTHEGSDSAYIRGGQIADVYLYLANVGPGGARICVEIEGGEPPVSCRRDTVIIDTLPHIPTWPPVIIGPDTVRYDSAAPYQCWSMKQALRDGRTSEGTLVTRARGFKTEAFLIWDCCTGMPLSGTRDPIVGGWTLGLNGNFPAGLSPEPMDQEYKIYYKGFLSDKNGFIDGNVHHVHTDWNETTYELLGDWTGMPASCPDWAGEVLQNLYGR